MAISFDDVQPTKKSNTSNKPNNSSNKTPDKSVTTDTKSTMKGDSNKDVASDKPLQYSRSNNDGSSDINVETPSKQSTPQSYDTPSDTIQMGGDDGEASFGQKDNATTSNVDSQPTQVEESQSYSREANDFASKPDKLAGNYDDDYVHNTLNQRHADAVASNQENDGSEYAGHDNSLDDAKQNHGKHNVDTSGKIAPSDGEVNTPGSDIIPNYPNENATANKNNANGNSSVIADEAKKQNSQNAGKIMNKAKESASKAVEKGVDFMKNGVALFTKGMAKAAMALGTSVKAMTMVTLLGGGVGSFLLVGCVFGFFNDNRIMYDEGEDDCIIVNEKFDENTNSSIGIGDADKAANAKDIYKALSADSIGYTDAAIAGILSNAEAETGINPKAYEGWSVENSQMQQYAFKDWHQYTLELHAYYARKGIDINEDAYIGSDGKKYPAFGYWQWTGPRTSNLMNFASEIDKASNGGQGITDADGDGFSDRVYDTDVQVAYLIKENRANVNSWGQNPGTESPSECAKWFCLNWEGNTKYLAEHMATAQQWYDLIQSEGWEADNEYANSILAMADVNLTEAGSQGMKAAVEGTDCEKPGSKTGSFDNSSIAAAACSWAWPQDHPENCDINDETTHDPYAANPAYQMTLCTSMYVVIKNVATNCDPYYSSCDRGAATAVLVSGSDDSFPLNLGSQQPYVKESDKWEYIGPCTSDTKDDLQPGDLLISDGHIIVYVGGEAAAAAFGSDYNASMHSVVHSSRSGKLSNSRGPRCDKEMYNYTGSFHIYRCVGANPESSEIKKKIDSMDFSSWHDGKSAATSVDTKASNWTSVVP